MNFLVEYRSVWQKLRDVNILSIEHRSYCNATFQNLFYLHFLLLYKHIIIAGDFFRKILIQHLLIVTMTGNRELRYFLQFFTYLSISQLIWTRVLLGFYREEMLIPVSSS